MTAGARSRGLGLRRSSPAGAGVGQGAAASQGAVIPVVRDVARLDPWDLPVARKGEGYFFSLRRAPATGGYLRRRAGSGYWKATGNAKPVFLQGSGCGGVRHLVGVKMALTFHHGKPSRASLRTGWASPLEAMT